MPRKLPKYVHSFIDKLRGRVIVRYYYRRGGKRIPLPGLPWSDEFMLAYAAASAMFKQQQQDAPVSAPAKPGSVDALILAFFVSPKFLGIPAPATRRTYRQILEAFAKKHGRKPVALLTRQHVDAMLAERVGKPAAANHWLRLMRKLMRFAVAEGWRQDDPTVGVDFIEHRSDGFPTWTEDEIAQFEQRHPIGSMARLALALMLYTALRRSDVVKMTRQHIRNGRVQVRQQKTGTPLIIPMHPDLAAILDATPVAITPTLLMTAYAKPFTVAGFGGWFRNRCDEAGLPHCSAHGLRKAACRRLAEAGCSANVIASISGHLSLREVERYTRAANQERMAQMGIAAMPSSPELATAGTKLATVEEIL
jgi:integrase